MPRFLIVEDDTQTSKVLRDLLKLNFTSPLPDEGEPQIDTASTVTEAKEFINNARKPYHVAILDFRLPPEHLGDSTKVDATACLQAMRSTPPPLIAHITSNPNDEKVKAHIKEYHTERANRYDFALSKLDSDYTEKLLGKLKKFLYERPIEEQLDLMFGREAQTRAPSLLLTPGRSRGQSCMTQELAELCRQIVAHWDDLDEPLKNRIEGIFEVNKASKPVKISLL
ncbi:MAG: response regulator [Acidobacteriota bacterium]|nr:response regulator [Acidobacteriota bacterium]